MQASCERYGVSDVLYRPLKKRLRNEVAFSCLLFPKSNRLAIMISTRAGQYPHLGCGEHQRCP